MAEASERHKLDRYPGTAHLRPLVEAVGRGASGEGVRAPPRSNGGGRSFGGAGGIVAHHVSVVLQCHYSLM